MFYINFDVGRKYSYLKKKQMKISKASLENTETIQQIGRETFFETFAEDNTEEDMKRYLEENFSTEKIRTELINPDSLFFIAWEDENPIGYLKLNSGKAQTELHDDVSIEIERIYVKSLYHGKKVGQLLYEKAIEVAKAQKKLYIWLGVWERNLKAIKFYEKNGFVAFDKHIFRVGNDEQTDILMRKEL